MGAPAGKIFGELTFGLQQHGMIRLFRDQVQPHTLGIVILPQDRRQARIAGHQLETPHR